MRLMVALGLFLCLPCAWAHEPCTASPPEPPAVLTIPQRCLPSLLAYWTTSYTKEDALGKLRYLGVSSDRYLHLGTCEIGRAIYKDGPDIVVPPEAFAFSPWHHDKKFEVLAGYVADVVQTGETLVTLNQHGQQLRVVVR